MSDINIFFKSTFNKASLFLCSYFVLIVLCADFITKVTLWSGFDFHRYGSIVKFSIELIFIISVLVNQTRNHKIAYLMYLLIGCFIIGQVGMVLLNKNIDGDFKDNFVTIISFVFLPLFILACFAQKNHLIIIQKNVKIIKVAALVNLPFIILGIITNSNILKSYPNSDRFGFNGFLTSSSSASYFYIALMIILYFQYIKLKKRKYLLVLLIQVFASLLMGTKTIWFFLILLSFIHFCVIINKNYRRFFQTLTTLLLVLTLIFWNKTKMFIVGLFSFGEEIYNEHGFISVILSTRDLYLKETLTHVIENGTILNILFGGINVKIIRVEFEFVNMFYFFGVFGTIIYFLFLKEAFYRENRSLLKILLFFAFMITGALSGGLFYSVSSSVLLYIAFRYVDIFTKTNDFETNNK